jgi:uncharacterized membrane protein YhdT
MQLLQGYFSHAQKTIQLFSHRKHWGLWWFFLLVHGVLSALQGAGLNVWVVAAHALVWASGLVLMALIIDAMVQLMGQRGELKTCVYWLGFASTVLWLLPSAQMIHHQWVLAGSMVGLSIYGVWGYHVVKTIQQVYSLNRWQLMACFIVPILFGIVMAMVLGGLTLYKVLML